MSSARSLDQFYTHPDVARACWTALYDRLPDGRRFRFLEPSAGEGAFFNLLPKDRRYGVDLEPKCEGVVSQDFFSWLPPKAAENCLVTVGNPPFGKNASLAVKFFNHAAGFSQIIAFIVPKSFRKDSVQKRLNRNFHLVADMDLGTDAFVFEGSPYDVPCSFQIWERRDEVREISEKPLEHHDFRFVSREEAHFAVRRVGARAGAVISSFDGYSSASHYFIRVTDSCRVEDVMETLGRVDWTEAKANSAGNPSVSKRELVELYGRQCQAVLNFKPRKRVSQPEAGVALAA